MRLDHGDIVLGRYKVGRMLGAGAMGEVYLGSHHQLGSLVAIKVLLIEASEKALQRFKREAQLMAKIRHPNVVSIHDYGALDDGMPCIVMEYVEGQDVESMIYERGVFAWRDATALLVQMLDGLHVLHQNGIIHRDLKPSNLIYTLQEPSTLKVVDFGTARTLDERSTKLTGEGMMVGTPAYMAPESLLGEPATPQSDIYAVGLIFYEMISGTLPFGSNNMSQVLKRLKKPLPEPVLAPDQDPLPRNLLRYLMTRFLCMDPDTRVSTALGCKRQLERFLSANTVEQTKPNAPLVMEPGKAMIFKKRKRRDGSSEPSTKKITQDTEKTREVSSQSDLIQAESKPQSLTPLPEPVVATPVVTSIARPRAVMMLKLPPSQLAKRTERAWLSTAMNQRGRAFVFGGQFWIAIFVSDEDSKSIEDAEMVHKVVVEKYGALAKVSVRLLAESFELSAAALSGAVALPDVFQTMMKELS